MVNVSIILNESLLMEPGTLLCGIFVGLLKLVTIFCWMKNLRMSTYKLSIATFCITIYMER